MGLMDKVKGMFGGRYGRQGEGPRRRARRQDHEWRRQGDRHAVDDKTKGKYSDPLQKVDDGVAKAIDELDGDK